MLLTMIYLIAGSSFFGLATLLLLLLERFRGSFVGAFRHHHGVRGQAGRRVVRLEGHSGRRSIRVVVRIVRRWRRYKLREVPLVWVWLAITLA